jgi:site-specific DNA recombinase
MGDSQRHGLALACENGAVLVVYSLSRLSRSTRDTIQLADRLSRANADLVSLSERIDTTSASGKMVFRIMAVLAEYEKDQIAERTSVVLQHKKANREVYSPIPYGFDRMGKMLVLNHAEQGVLEEISRHP